MATPTITYDGLPPATLPLNGTETVTFEQNGVTVKAALSDIFANVAGVSLLGLLELLSADGQTLLGSLGPVEDLKVGLLSADGTSFLVINNDGGAEAQGSWAFYDADNLGGGDLTEWTQFTANYYDGVRVHSQNVDDYSTTTMGHFGFDTLFAHPENSLLARISTSSDGFSAFAYFVDIQSIISIHDGGITSTSTDGGSNTGTYNLSQGSAQLRVTNGSTTGQVSISAVSAQLRVVNNYFVSTPDYVQMQTPGGDIKILTDGTATLNGLPIAVVQPVPTVDRPDPAVVGAGYSVFDTSLGAHGKPIWSTGSAWVDATGTLV